MFSYRAESNAPLVWAVQQDQPQIVRLLLDKHANIRAQDVSGNSCLSFAVGFNHLNAQAIAAMLLAQGVDVNAHNFLGETPLITAADSQVNPALIKLLLDHGADVSARDPNGETAFFKFILSNHKFDDPAVLQITKILFDAGADVNDKDINGITPLMQAAYSGNQALIKLLLDHGAKISLRDNKGKTALVHAVDLPLPLEGRFWNGPLKTATLLLNSGANVNDTGFAKTLLDSGVMSVNHRYSNPPLLLRLMYFLQEHRADVNIKGSQGTTPLMICSETEDPQAARLLLAQGADVNARDNYGQTALMVAANGGHLAVARLLLAHGADRAAQDRKGRTALDRARRNRFEANPPFDSPALGQKFTVLLSK